MEIGNHIENLIDSRKDEELVSFLNENNAKNNEIWWEYDLFILTPLSYACERKRVKTVQALINAGLTHPNFEPPNIEMKTYLEPVAAAANNSNKEILKLLLQAGFSSVPALEMFERLAGNDGIEALLELMPAKMKAIYKLVQADNAINSLTNDI